MKLRWQIAVLLGVSLLAFGNSLLNSFTLDDEMYIKRNPQVTEHSLRLLFRANESTSVYRPVTFATFAANWLVAGYRPKSYHLVNLLLHAAVTLLFFFALRKALEGMAHYETISFVAALLFASHPIHTEAVSSVVGRSELLAAGFLFAAWLLHLTDRWVLALLSFALALLSKESAIGLLPLAIVGDYAAGKLRSWTRYTGIALITALYLVVLWKAQGGHFGPPTVSILDNPLVMLPAHLRVLNAIRISWKYVFLLLFPATLSCDYSYNQIYLYGNARHLLVGVIAALGVLGAWTWAVRRRRSGYAIAGTLFFAGFAATSNILTQTGTIFGERLAYFPSAGFCLLVAVLWSLLMQRGRYIAFVVLALVLGAFTARTIARNRDWRDNVALYLAGADASPKSAKMRVFRAAIYVDRADFDKARSDLQFALDTYPDYPDAVEGMGLLEARTGNTAAALKLLEKALEMSDRKDFFFDFRAANLAALEIQTGRVDDAMKLLNREITLSPAYSRLWSNRATLRLKLGQTAEARSDALTALRLDPSNGQATDVLNAKPRTP
jgi:tetratricopeptide (TPR) repeat protein